MGTAVVSAWGLRCSAGFVFPSLLSDAQVDAIVRDDASLMQAERRLAADRPISALTSRATPEAGLLAHARPVRMRTSTTDSAAGCADYSAFHVPAVCRAALASHPCSFVSAAAAYPVASELRMMLARTRLHGCRRAPPRAAVGRDTERTVAARHDS